ncbi:MAG: LysM peptidoglycan-binding domain-containing protein [Desulfobacterium sp.]|nr:LysM peptidoglycan-binding domain-containing protein [Desulfobacterium sp.]
MVKDAKDNPPSTFGARQNLKSPETDDRKKSSSFFKKGDFSMIFIGAGIITVIVFVMLFRSDKDKSIDLAAPQVEVQALEDRIGALETLVATLEKRPDTTALSTPSLDSYQARVERVEAALSMKFDLVAARLSVLEKKIEGFERSSKGTAKAEPAPKAIAAPPVKKAVSKSETKRPEPQKSAAGTVTHTVKKGETLYGISREYNTTVAKLRDLNKLSDKAEIFPGETLVVQP